MRAARGPSWAADAGHVLAARPTRGPRTWGRTGFRRRPPSESKRRRPRDRCARRRQATHRAGRGTSRVRRMCRGMEGRVGRRTSATWRGGCSGGPRRAATPCSRASATASARGENRRWWRWRGGSSSGAGRCCGTGPHGTTRARPPVAGDMTGKTNHATTSLNEGKNTGPANEQAMNRRGDSSQASKRDE